MCAGKKSTISGSSMHYQCNKGYSTQYFMPWEKLGWYICHIWVYISLWDIPAAHGQTPSLLNNEKLQYWELSPVQCLLAHVPFMAEHLGSAQRNGECLVHRSHLAVPPKEHSGSALQTSHPSPQKLSDPWPCWSQWDNSSLYPCSVGESSWDHVSCTTGLLTLSQGNCLGLLRVTFPTIFNYPNLGITFLPFPGMWLNSNKITI